MNEEFSLAISRRSVLRLATALPMGVAVPAVVGCAAVGVTRVGPFLELLKDSLASGLGFTFGTGLAAEAMEAIESVTDKLALRIDNPFEQSISGYAPGLDRTQPLRALASAIFLPKGFQRGFESETLMRMGTGERLIPSILALGLSMYAKNRVARRVDTLTGRDPKSVARETAAWLRESHSILSYEKLSGGTALTEESVFQAILKNGNNLRVEWYPTTEVTTQSRIVALEGIDMQGLSPKWKYRETEAIPSYALWEAVES